LSAIERVKTRVDNQIEASPGTSAGILREANQTRSLRSSKADRLLAMPAINKKKAGL